MSDPGLSFDEETLSPDIFNDVDNVTNNPVNSDDCKILIKRFEIRKNYNYVYTVYIYIYILFT